MRVSLGSADIRRASSRLALWAASAPRSLLARICAARSILATRMSCRSTGPPPLSTVTLKSSGPGGSPWKVSIPSLHFMCTVFSSVSAMSQVGGSAITEVIDAQSSSPSRSPRSALPTRADWQPSLVWQPPCTVCCMIRLRLLPSMELVSTVTSWLG